MSLYAEDTAISVSSSEPLELELKLNNALAKVSDWYKKNKLSVNLDKTKVMFFGTKPQLTRMENVNVKLENVAIARVTKFKYLGLVLDCSLTFSQHVEYIKSKTFAKIRLLGKLSYILDRNTLLLLYKTLILPIFDYGDIVYAGINKQDSDTLQKPQNVACRAIL